MQIILTILGILYGAFSLFCAAFLAAACFGQRHFNRKLEGEPVPSPVTSQAEEEKLTASIPSNALSLPA
jgi:hypothetical protein